MKVCIIGAGAAGRSASGQIRQLDSHAQIDIFSTQDEIGYAPCEPPFVLKGMVKWNDIFYPGDFFRDRNISVHLNTEITDIIRNENRVVANGISYQYDKLILCLGAIPSIPSIPGLNGENEFTVSTNIADTKAIEKIIPNYGSGAVIGAGAIGVEMGMALLAREYHHVYLLDMLENVLPQSLDKDMAEKIEEVMKQNGLELIPSANVINIESESTRKCIVLPDRKINVDLVFLTTGARPHVKLAEKAGIETGETGGISVNQYLQTSDPDIYAAGDCIENWDMIIGAKTRRLMVTTAGITGDIAARNLVLGNSIPYQGTLMSFVIDVFGHQIGTVGFTERLAMEKGLDVVSSTTSNPSTRPRYGGKPFHCKFVADRKTHALVGAQIISEDKIRGIVNEMLLAIAERVPLHRLIQLESPYSPAVGMDPIRGGLARLMYKLR